MNQTKVRELKDMELHDLHHDKEMSFVVFRVATGWIYYQVLVDHGVSGGVFVPERLSPEEEVVRKSEW